MRHWASTIPNVQFLEVCVVDSSVALDFHRSFGFGHNPEENDLDVNPVVVNGWIPSRHYMPVGYGQLGCSGFVISDDKGNFVTKRTPAYLEYREGAFRHVESILADLLVEMASEEEKKQGEAPKKTSMERIPPAMSPKRQSDCKKQKKESSSQSSSSREASPTTVTKPIEAPPSVGVDSMDAEHQICTDSFNRALKDPTFETLQEVYLLLRNHFLHEEDLIAKYAINDPEQLHSPFSAFTSHRKDHGRILSIAARELARVFEMHRAATSSNNNSSCSVENGVAA